MFTSVTGPARHSARPFIVVTAVTPAVDTEIGAWEIMVPTIVPPPNIPLMVAAPPTYQKTFLACAPLSRSTLQLAVGCPPERRAHLEDPERIGVSLGIKN